MKGRNAPGINLYGPESKTNYSHPNMPEASALLVTKTIFTKFKCEDLERNTGVVPVCLEAKSGLIRPLYNRIAFSTKTGLSLYSLESMFYKTTPLWLHKKTLSTVVDSVGVIEDDGFKTSFIFCHVLKVST